MNMTKREVRDALGFTLDKELAEFFGVGKAAVSNWPEDDPLPEVRQWQARATRPDIFPVDFTDPSHIPAANDHPMAAPLKFG